MNSAKRYYLNIFEDTQRQHGVNLVIGNEDNHDEEGFVDNTSSKSDMNNTNMGDVSASSAVPLTFFSGGATNHHGQASRISKSCSESAGCTAPQSPSCAMDATEKELLLDDAGDRKTTTAERTLLHHAERDIPAFLDNSTTTATTTSACRIVNNTMFEFNTLLASRTIKVITALNEAVLAQRPLIGSTTSALRNEAQLNTPATPTLSVRPCLRSRRRVGVIERRQLLHSARHDFAPHRSGRSSASTLLPRMMIPHSRVEKNRRRNSLHHSPPSVITDNVKEKEQTQPVHFLTSRNERMFLIIIFCFGALGRMLEVGSSPSG